VGGDATIAGGAAALACAGGALLAAVLCVGCASTGTHTAVSRNAAPETTAAGGAAWDLPAGAVPSQRLYQGSYEGPEGGGTFRATLRLAALKAAPLVECDRVGVDNRLHPPASQLSREFLGVFDEHSPVPASLLVLTNRHAAEGRAVAVDVHANHA